MKADNESRGHFHFADRTGQQTEQSSDDEEEGDDGEAQDDKRKKVRRANFTLPRGHPSLESNEAEVTLTRFKRNGNACRL